MLISLMLIAAWLALMIYVISQLVALWAWGSKRGVSDALMTLFGIMMPVGSWVISMCLQFSKDCGDAPLVMWVWPLSMGVLYFLVVKPRAELVATINAHRTAERAAAEDQVLAQPDDGSARMTLARIAEEEGRFDDALSHYQEAHRASEIMFSSSQLETARDHVDTLRGVAKRKRGPLSRPLDVVALAVSGLFVFYVPIYGLAPLSALLFLLWERGDLGQE